MGSLLIPLVSRLAAKAGDAFVGELMQAWGLDKARRKLERHLAVVQSILLDAEVKSRTDPAVREWIKDLKTAAYHADDVLDDFRYKALRRRAAQIRPHSTAHKVLSYFTANSPVVFRLHMSWKLKNALERIDELVVEMKNFHFLQHAESPSVVHPQTYSYVDESRVVGRKDEKEQVMKILLDHNNTNNDNVMVLPIVGMGGIGKTTLAQLVYNDERVKRHFELVLWVCVSHKFVIEEIIRSITEVATMKKSKLTQSEALQKALIGILGSKRYLLVLDDVWNEDREKWDNMRSLLCSHAGSGSAIIVTSRSDQVASIMGTHPPHRISLLAEDQSWELFHRNAFGRKVEEQAELILMAKNIVRKCKGLPLAIKTIATLLSSKDQSQWFSVMDSGVWKDDIVANTGIEPALQLSYDHLSSEEKICFSLCAIFPKDSLMDKDMLIQLWMANDFIASEIRGQQIFDVLVWRCFLQDVQIQKNPDSPFRNESIHRPTTCKMHDLMHDLADSVSRNDCFILQSSNCSILQSKNDCSIMEKTSSFDDLMRALDDSVEINDCFFLRKSSSRQNLLQRSTYPGSLQHEVWHLSVDYVDDNNTITAMEDILVHRPRTILVCEWGTPRCMAKLKFMSLRALKTTTFETHMTKLKHLRYLDCSYSHIAALPEATATLYSLQTLKLTGCSNLKKLPEGMRYMSCLRHIFLVGCDSLNHMPQGIGHLNSLQTLTNYVIDSDAGRGIDQLKDLNLGGALCLTQLRKVHSAENAKQGNMSAKHNLKRLSLNWYGPSSTRVGCKVDTNAEGILEALRPHKTLEVLLLFNYTGAKLSSWMHNSILLDHLNVLRMSSCKNCKDLSPLWQLPTLKYLHLDNLDSLTSISVDNNASDIGQSCISPLPFFPKLETMKVYNMPKLRRWHQEVRRQVSVVSFPLLKKLVIYNCPRLKTLPEGLLQQRPALEELYIERCPNLEGAFSRGGTHWNLVQGFLKEQLADLMC